MASDEVAQIKGVHAAEVARLKEEHAAEEAQLKEELAAENAQLKEELTAERFHRDRYDMGVNDMMQLTLTLYEGIVSPDKLKQEAKVLLDIEDGGCSSAVNTRSRMHCLVDSIQYSSYITTTHNWMRRGVQPS